MSRPPRIFFVNRFYWPDEPATAQLLTDLSIALTQHGLAVSVVSSPSTRTHQQPPEELAGIAIHRVGGPRLGQSRLWTRAMDFWRFSRAARRLLAAELVAGDSVVALTDPPLLGNALAKVCRHRPVKLLHWIQDIFPEVATAATGFAPANLLKSGRDHAWRAATYCVVPGEDMAAHVARRGVPAERIRRVSNWAPHGLAPTDATQLRRNLGLDARFVIGYSGNLGRVHEITFIADLADRFRGDDRIAFAVFGGGAQRAALEQRLRALQLLNLHLLPAQPRETLSVSLSVPDLHLVTLREGFEQLVFPSKLYGITAVGRPVMWVGPLQAEVSRLVTTHGCGQSFQMSDLAGMSAFIRKLADSPEITRALGAASHAFSLREGTLDSQLPRWLDLLAPRATVS